MEMEMEMEMEIKMVALSYTHSVATQNSFKPDAILPQIAEYSGTITTKHYHRKDLPCTP